MTVDKCERCGRYSTSPTCGCKPFECYLNDGLYSGSDHETVYAETMEEAAEIVAQGYNESDCPTIDDVVLDVNGVTLVVTVEAVLTYTATIREKQ